MVWVMTATNLRLLHRFLYKFLHDKFVYEVKQADENSASQRLGKELAAYSEDKFELLALELGRE